MGCCLFFFLCPQVIFTGHFYLSGNFAFHAKPRLFHAHVLPEGGISCKTAAIMGCVVKSEELVLAGSTVHCRVLVLRQPDQGAGHSHHRPPHVLEFPSCG